MTTRAKARGRAAQTIAGFGQRVRRLRKAAGLTQADLAERLATTKSHISQVEHDLSNFSVPMLIAFCETTRMSPEHVIGSGFKQSRKQKHAREIAELLSEQDLAFLAGLTRQEVEKVVARGREAITYQRQTPGRRRERNFS